MNAKDIINKICVAVAAFSMLAGLILQPMTAAAAEFPLLQAFGVDTIAGYSTLMRSSRTFPKREIVFVVTKPDGAKVNVPAVTDDQGVAKADLYDYHTRRAGRYSLSARFKEDLTKGSESTFVVYPDQVSLEQSSIVAGKTLAKAGGGDNVYLTVSIKDQYGNPFQGHAVSLISSRSSDNLKAAGGTSTDINGSITYSVNSPDAGVSVFSAVDSTAGVVLSARTQVAFINGSLPMADAGGNLGMFIPVAEAAESGPLHHFKISEIPATVEPNANVSFKVTAQDASDLTVENYTGTVHFSAQGGGDNVTMPEDYTFKAEDLGTHLFSLGLSFTTAGTYKLTATDTSDILIKGETTVVVGEGGTGTTTETGQKPVITTPAAGSYSDNIQTVSGSAQAGVTIKIFDNDQEIGSVQVSSSGSFTYQTGQLSDGTHKVYVISVDGTGNVTATSETVEFTIDTTPPSVDEVQVDPSSGITPGKVINIKVMSEENLSDSALIFNSEIVALVPMPAQPGTYTAQLTAPEAPGAYPVDVVLVDQLNNEVTYKAKATVNVAEGGGTVETEGTQETQATEETQQPVVVEPANLPPTQVFGLIAYGSDKRVTLVWEAANDDVNVNHYKVRYGLDPVTLDKTAETKSASTTWYIPNLENGKEYYFAVAAVDDAGLESPAASETVSGIPFTLEISPVIPPKPLGPLAGDFHGSAIEGPYPPEVTKNGPEIVWLLAGTGLLSGAIGKIRRRIRKGR